MVAAYISTLAAITDIIECPPPASKPERQVPTYCEVPYRFVNESMTRQTFLSEVNGNWIESDPSAMYEATSGCPFEYSVGINQEIYVKAPSTPPRAREWRRPSRSRWIRPSRLAGEA